MPDRRRRTALHLPPPAGPVLLPRERQSPSTGSSGSSGPDDSSGSSGSQGSSGSSGPGGSSDDNPFAPPPEGRPDQPWQPRRPEDGGTPDNGSGSDSDRGKPSWGSQWSSRQPGRSDDGFGHRPGAHSGQGGQGGPGGQKGPGGPKDGSDGRGGGLRWDPADPAQRRARYALLSGMWAFFFALFDFPEIALLLGALALYWSISALRNKPKQPGGPDQPRQSAKQARQTASVDALTGRGGPVESTPAAASPAAPGTTPPAPSGSPARPQITAAVSGLVTASLALLIVAATFTVQLAYSDYYTCVNNSLTKTGQLSCNSELPDSLVPLFGVKE